MNSVLKTLILICVLSSTSALAQQPWPSVAVTIATPENLKSRQSTLMSFDRLPESNSSRTAFRDAWHTIYVTEPESTQQPSSADAAELATKLNNPVSSLMSVPFQNNFDYRMGPNEDGFRYTLNVQPVIPFRLSNHWNLISRTITPFIYQHDVVGATSKTGLGDITQSLFFSPGSTEPFVWGVGPALLLPTATDDQLGSGKLGIGPTLVILKQSRGWTYGALLNHIWSVAGDDSRSDVSSTFMQPFLTYTTKTAWTFALNTEASYDWKEDQWSIPIHPYVSKLMTFGKQRVNIGGGLRCWTSTTPNGPEGCGLRFFVTPVFPKA